MQMISSCYHPFPDPRCHYCTLHAVQPPTSSCCSSRLCHLITELEVDVVSNEAMMPITTKALFVAAKPQQRQRWYFPMISYD